MSGILFSRTALKTKTPTVSRGRSYITNTINYSLIVLCSVITMDDISLAGFISYRCLHFHFRFEFLLAHLHF